MINIILLPNILLFISTLSLCNERVLVAIVQKRKQTELIIFEYELIKRLEPIYPITKNGIAKNAELRANGRCISKCLNKRFNNKHTQLIKIILHILLLNDNNTLISANAIKNHKYSHIGWNDI